MNKVALETIKRGNRKWTIAKCRKHVKKIIGMVSTIHPEGLEGGKYFVIPGFEHVTKNQPIISYNSNNREWDLEINTTFKR